jgi:hypothetical protein
VTVPRRTQLSSPKTFVSDEVDGRGER